jgi:hypothetical protein
LDHDWTSISRARLSVACERSADLNDLPVSDGDVAGRSILAAQPPVSDHDVIGLRHGGSPGSS